MIDIRFFVPGKPQSLKRHRTRRLSNGITIQMDPSKEDKADFLVMAMAHRPDEPINEPVCLEMCCVFQRPKSHYRTGRNAHLLKDTAPYWYSRTPDADNLLKFVCDALNGIYWTDDKLVIPMGIHRVYGTAPGVYVRVHKPTSFHIQYAVSFMDGQTNNAERG